MKIDNIIRIRIIIYIYIYIYIYICVCVYVPERKYIYGEWRYDFRYWTAYRSKVPAIQTPVQRHRPYCVRLYRQLSSRGSCSTSRIANSLITTSVDTDHLRMSGILVFKGRIGDC